MVRERQRLLAGRIPVMLQIDGQTLWRAGKACYELLDEGLAVAPDVLASDRVLEARYRPPMPVLRRL